MVICLDKDTLSRLTCRRKIEMALWVIWIQLGFSEESCGVELSCIIYTRKSGLPVRDRIFDNFRKSKYRSKFLIWFLGITHQRVSLEKLWAIRKNWSCPEILDGYRKSLLRLRQETQYLASTLTVKFNAFAGTYVVQKKNGARTRGEVIVFSTFTELHGHGDERRGAKYVLLQCPCRLRQWFFFSCMNAHAWDILCSYTT